MGVIGNDAMHFCAREIELPCDQRHGFGRDAAELLLYLVQNRQQGARQGLIRGDDAQDGTKIFHAAL